MQYVSFIIIFLGFVIIFLLYLIFMISNIYIDLCVGEMDGAGFKKMLVRENCVCGVVFMDWVMLG